jgi:tRNA-specific adenosine deaminase 1
MTQSEESRAAFYQGKRRRVEASSDVDKDDGKMATVTEISPIKQETSDTKSNVRRGRHGFEYTGVLRTKPGRIDSEPTICMSCR